MMGRHPNKIQRHPILNTHTQSMRLHCVWEDLSLYTSLIHRRRYEVPSHPYFPARVIFHRWPRIASLVIPLLTAGRIMAGKMRRKRKKRNSLYRRSKRRRHWDNPRLWQTFRRPSTDCSRLFECEKKVIHFPKGSVVLIPLLLLRFEFYPLIQSSFFCPMFRCSHCQTLSNFGRKKPKPAVNRLDITRRSTGRRNL